MPKTTEEKLDSKVSWKVYIWTISIITMLFGVALGVAVRANQKVDGFSPDIVEIKVGIKEIQTDQKWIKETLDKHLISNK
jgi:hypothetical protein